MQNKIKILQGANTIGGNIVQIEGEVSRLILDFGLPLTDINGNSLGLKLESPEITKYLPDISDLYNDEQDKKTLVFLSHAHPDHYALAHLLNPSIPIYCHKFTKDFIKKGSALLYKNLYDNLNLLEFSSTIETEDFLIELLEVNHSIAGSCAFKILDKSTKEKLLYCGDIRLHGRINREFENFFSQNKDVDYLIIEGTTLSRYDSSLKTESDIEDDLVELFMQNKLNLVSFSPLNIDRMISVYKATQRVGKTLVVDPYTAYILGNDKEIKYNSEDLKIFCIGDGNTKKIFINDYYKKLFGRNKVDKDELKNNPEKFVIKDNRAISDFLSKYHNLNNANLIYSYWSGYMNCENFHWKKYRNQIKQIHTSGHIDVENLVSFIEKINPKKIIPIHTISIEKFEELFKNRILIL